MLVFLSSWSSGREEQALEGGYIVSRHVEGAASNHIIRSGNHVSLLFDFEHATLSQPCPSQVMIPSGPLPINHNSLTFSCTLSID